MSADYKKTIDDIFTNREYLICAIYAAGGTKPRGYGFISGGYGGGVDIDQFHALLWADGIIIGLTLGDKKKGHNLMKAINTALEIECGLANSATPFINLTEAD